MKKFALIGAAALLVFGCKPAVDVNDPYQIDTKLVQQLEESNYVHSIMKEFTEDSGMKRWEEKEVLESRELPLVEDFESLKCTSPYGVLSIEKDITHSGKGSVCVTTPASGPVKMKSNRNYGSPDIFKPLDGEDLTEWNRFSCWVYVDAPGYYIAFLGFKLVNEGIHPTPTPGRFEGEHYVSVHPGEWIHIIWEIPDLYRDKVTGFAANIMMNGETAGASSTMKLYVDDMRIEKVKAENSRGFDLRDDAIAYSHNGYRIGARKEALVQNAGTTSFVVKDDITGKVAFKGEAAQLEGGFAMMDFTKLDKQGRYTLEIGQLKSKPFFIGNAAYLATAWHLINFFFAERCGFDQPGIHQPCHEDVYIHHPDGRVISMAGGWHDAADLTQGVGNNCEAGVAMMELADQVKDSDPALYKRILEEARWGLNWVLKTRFEDGYRVNGLVIGIWTKNIRGDKDDMDGVATNNPLGNFRAAEYEAMAVKHYEPLDPVFARWCREAAIADFEFGKQQLTSQAPDVNGMAIIAAMRLYELTGEESYIEYAAERARIVMACQDMEEHADWTIPMHGFFYETPEHQRTLTYYHQSQEHRMVQALALLLQAEQTNADAQAWAASLQAYADYLKATAKVMEPYGLLPAAIYEVNNTDYSHFSHEGDKSLGAPSLEEYNDEVTHGIQLGGSTYLRRFPVAYQFRGFNATVLAKAKAAFILADIFKDQQLKDIAMRQVEWITGFNPFAMNTIYGDGYDYPLLYGAYAGNVVGAVPVGIETFEGIDEPYFPMQSNCTYKEIWTHSTARMISCVAEMFKY